MIIFDSIPSNEDILKKIIVNNFLLMNLLTFSVLLLVGCGGTSSISGKGPSSDINIKNQDKISLVVGVIFNDEFSNYIFRDNIVYISKFQMKNKIHKQTNRRHIELPIGESSKDLFFNGLNNIFDNVIKIQNKKEALTCSNCALIIEPKITSASITIDAGDTSFIEGRILFTIKYHVSIFSPDEISFEESYHLSGYGRDKKDENIALNLLKLPFQLSLGLVDSVGAGMIGILSVQERRALSFAVKKAEADAFSQLISRLKYSQELKNYANKIHIEKTLPCSLKIKTAFNDIQGHSPNKIIDAAEESIITVILKNEGKGTAFDIKLNTESKSKNVNFPEIISLGDIQPGQSKEVKIDIKADLALEEGTIPFAIFAKEKRGYNSKTYKINIQAASLHKPDIIISGYKINDGNTGLAEGNGNGIPENGETIELIPFVKNTGVGKALQVELKISSINSEIDIKKKSLKISEIIPGQTVAGSLSFKIPPTFSDQKLDLHLVASDVRGASEAKKLLTLNTQSRYPVIAYKYRIIDYNGDGFLENGEEGEVEIISMNKGKMDARSVNISLESGDIEFKKNSEYIERIAADSKYVPQRFGFKVPRILQKDNVSIKLTFSQANFSGLTDTITHSIKLVLPDFSISHQIFDQGNHNGILEEGETADVIVRIRNVGEIDAQDVVLNIKTDGKDMIQEGVRLLGKKSVSIGKIAAGGQSAPQPFSIYIQRMNTDMERELVMQFDIIQKDFKNKILPLALKIEKERDEVITIAGQQKSKTTAATVFTSSNTAPLIAIGLPRNNQRVVKNTETLVGNVVDDKGVSVIEVMVNGRRLNPGRDIGVHQKIGQNEKEYFFNYKIPLNIGENTITVRAFDIENLSRESSITVYRESERGEIYAAVIGINKYKNVPDLQYACKDAKAFVDYLHTNMNLDSNHIFELYDQNATVSGIRTLLGTKLKDKANKLEDTVLIFYAGHGAPEDDPYSKDNDGITKYILSYEADPENLYGTAIPMYEIANLFRRIRAERLIFISDSCFSGASGGRTIIAQGMRAGNLSEGFLNRLAQGKGRIILTSSSANEVSHESDQLGHGVFTYYLLKGLKGEADVDNDKLISADEISLYLKKAVRDETKGAQNPVKKGDSEGIVIVGKVK